MSPTVFWIQLSDGGWLPLRGKNAKEAVERYVNVAAVTGEGVTIAGTGNPLLDGEWTVGFDADENQHFITQQVPPHYPESASQ